MAKLPDGMVTIFKPYKTKIGIERKELIMCKNCEWYSDDQFHPTWDGKCGLTGINVRENYFCSWAKKRQ